jgi:hypothetical protein
MKELKKKGKQSNYGKEKRNVPPSSGYGIPLTSPHGACFSVKLSARLMRPAVAHKVCRWGRRVFSGRKRGQSWTRLHTKFCSYRQSVQQGSPWKRSAEQQSNTDVTCKLRKLLHSVSRLNWHTLYMRCCKHTLTDWGSRHIPSVINMWK